MREAVTIPRTDTRSPAVAANTLVTMKEDKPLHSPPKRGEWALVKMRDEENQWLFIKTGNNLQPSGSTCDLSTAAGRTMDAISEARTVKKARRSKEPVFIQPMKAKLAASLPISEEWLYELKLGGYRFLATKGGDAVHLWSRTEHDLSARFPHIVEAVQALPCDTAIFDGELIVPDERGCPSFQLIQNASDETPVQAFVFDLL